MRDVNDNVIDLGDDVLEVGAPVEEPGKITGFAVDGKVCVEWSDSTIVWYDYSTDLMKVFGQDGEGGYLISPPTS